tara:strand:- start:351 stop:545 length:195 start_codon:yes stop_codon:yes gene_type:complete
LNKPEFDKNGIDSSGLHWLQYAAFAFAALNIYLTWAFFFNDKFHQFVIKILRLLDCSGFNCNGV